jgi:hypothetical protein
MEEDEETEIYVNIFPVDVQKRSERINYCRRITIEDYN